MKTRTEKLIEEIKKIAEKYQKEINGLSYNGPNGGTNARLIPGWYHTGNATITRACGIAGVPRLNYWSGSNPTPATSIPLCISIDVIKAYKKIFKK